MERRASIDRFLARFTDTLGYGVGDIVSYLPMPGRFLGSVVSIDPKIRKVFVDWGGCGNVRQHEPDDLHMVPIQDPAVKRQMGKNKIARIASAIVMDDGPRKVSADTATLLRGQFMQELASSALYYRVSAWLANLHTGLSRYFARAAEFKADSAMAIYAFLIQSNVSVQFPDFDACSCYDFSVGNICREYLGLETASARNWKLILDYSKRNCDNDAVNLHGRLAEVQSQLEDEAQSLSRYVSSGERSVGDNGFIEGLFV